MEQKFSIFKILKNQIFKKDITPTEFETRLRIFSKKLRYGSIPFWQFISLLSGIILFILLLKDFNFTYLIFTVISTVIYTFLAIKNKKIKKTKYYLMMSIDSIKKIKYNYALSNMINLYNIVKDKEILDIIIDFSNNYPPSEDVELQLVDILINESNDKKLIDILNQIKNTLNYISKHKKVIELTINKTNKLSKDAINAADIRHKREYNKLISRYNSIQDLEKSKIEFYQKAKLELQILKENHLITQEIQREKNKLSELEDNVLQKSVYESYDTEIDDFISYENAYIQAINDYSEQISSSDNQNIFEETINLFKNKTESI